MGQEPPIFSLVLPLYNEAESVERVVARLEGALALRGWPHEIILVVNGSRDATGAVCAELARRFPACRVVTVPVNIGYGNGVLAGLSVARGTWVGFMAGDGQIAPDDVCRVIDVLLAGAHDVVKAVRVERCDTRLRRIVSFAYRLTIRLFFAVESLDTHGIPKFLRRENLRALQLASRDWFLDDEVMIKARALGLSLCEVPVAWRERVGGRSHVRPGAVLEFLANLAAWKLWRIRRWQKRHPRS